MFSDVGTDLRNQEINTVTLARTPSSGEGFGHSSVKFSIDRTYRELLEVEGSEIGFKASSILATTKNPFFDIDICQSIVFPTGDQLFINI